jgi:hypothetical protein
MVAVVEMDFAITTIYVNNNGRGKKLLALPLYLLFIILTNTQVATKSSLH